jgi:membrane protein
MERVSGRESPSLGDRLARIGDRVLDLPPARWLKPILDAYDTAGGGLLAAGLAWNTLFALLPAILLVISIIGIYLGDPARLESVITLLADRFPPIATFLSEAVTEFSRGAVSFGIIGLVGLIWGSSRFYQSLDDAMARIFRGSPRRDPVQRGIRGVISVLLMIGGLILATYLLAFVEQVGTDVPGLGWLTRRIDTALGSFVASIALFSLAIGVIYRIVPTVSPSWREIGLPAAVVGTVLAVLTAIFAIVAPRMVGSLAVYGAFVAVFAAMIWLSFVTQAILLGAAWVHRRGVIASARRAD